MDPIKKIKERDIAMLSCILEGKEIQLIKLYQKKKKKTYNDIFAGKNK